MRPLYARWLIEVGDCGWTGERQAADERGDGGNGPWQTAADLPPARLLFARNRPGANPERQHLATFIKLEYDYLALLVLLKD